MNFVYDPLPYRVVFGAGSLARVGDEIERVGQRALILSTPEQRDQAEQLRERIGAKAVGIFSDATMHVPVATVTEAAAVAADMGADCTIAIGGGSTTGLAKALSLKADLPSLVIPTTYAGSEVTTIWGLTENGVKTTGKDRRVLPKVVIYDPDLTLSLPTGMSVASGLNAIAHCMEGLYAVDGNPIVSLMAEEGLRVLARSLPAIRLDAGDRTAREQALYGCWLAGSVLGAASVALHHKLCHTLGGAFDMPHAQTHTAVLPHAIAYNASASPDAMTRAARALGRDDVPGALFDLAKGLGAEMALAKLGMPFDGIDRAADLAVRNPYPNPRPITVEGVRALLAAAYAGDRPVVRKTA
jgi:alcohol dehydrogenase class IV